MNSMNKIRVAVLFGGRSAEHEISLRSATNVIQFLDRNLFEVIPIGIDKGGNWYLGNEVFKKSLIDHTVPLSLSEPTWFSAGWVSSSTKTTEQSIPTLNNKPQFDVIFPVVHGTLCEDGTLQGLLELADIPYVGCGVLASAMGMDKDISKRLAMLANINIAPYIVIKQDQWKAAPEKYTKLVAEKLSYPVFVKPANTGSSVGISKVKTADQLKAAVDEAFIFDTKILIEKALNIMELELAVLESLDDNADPIVSEVGEVKPSHDFYSYEAKYLDENGAELIIPAVIPDALKQKAKEVAKELFIALECQGMARVDLFLTKDTNEIYFNEINTIPGFTKISMYPKLIATTGMDYPSLLTHLIHLAMKRHKAKSQLRRSFQE